MVDNHSSPQDIPRENGQMVSGLRIRSGSVAPSRIEVSVRTMECDDYPTTQTSSVSYTTTDPHGNYKAHEVSLDVDIERGPEKCADSEASQMLIPLCEL